MAMKLPMHGPHAVHRRDVDFSQTVYQAHSIRYRHFVSPKDKSKPDFVSVYKTKV